jgi:hypothetical protein
MPDRAASTGEPPEIEITQEMIAAGEVVLFGYHAERSNPASVVSKLFTSMLRLSSRQYSP